MTVEPAAFVSAMTERWQSFGNVPSDKLQAVWSQMVHTFNDAIRCHSSSSANKWRVLQPETGTGKSQGLAVYSALLPEVDHPGVLIVVRLKAQADELVSIINEVAKEDVATAHHSDTDTTPADLLKFPVLVITHRAYEMGLDALSKGQENVSNWSSFMAWGLEGRKLVVIDEALDIIEVAQVAKDDVDLLLGVIPGDIKRRYRPQFEAIETLRHILEEMELATEANPSLSKEKFLRQARRSPLEYDFTELRRELRRIRYDLRLNRRDDASMRQGHAQHFDNLLKGIQLTLDNWNWYARDNGKHTINTARIIVPEDAPHVVILDATASSNLIYDLFASTAAVIPCPEGARRYGNVTLHVSTGHRVGKTALRQTAKTEGAKLLASLEETLGADKSVFVACHKSVKPHLLGYETKFTNFDVGHWNAIDGRNDWQDYDTAVIFGLPYRDTVWSGNVTQAFIGPQSTEWLRSEGDRPYAGFKDVRKDLETGQIIVSVVQAINRVRCRRVIDVEGNCLPTDVFILLPAGARGESLLEGIRKEMPGIKVKEWKYSHAKRRHRRSNHEAPLIEFARNMRDGRRSATKIKDELGIPDTNWKRLVRKIRDPASDLAKELTEANCRYEVTGAGRGGTSHLVKN